MKKLLFLIVFIFASASTFAQSQIRVNGYTKSNGTYVSGYYRTLPNYTHTICYTPIGNVNPYTKTARTKPRGNCTRYTYSAPSYGDSDTLYTNSQAGQRYINSNGNRTYISR
nr:hypothetical protein [uncultured Flavobacterium sp.]